MGRVRRVRRQETRHKRIAVVHTQWTGKSVLVHKKKGGWKSCGSSSWTAPGCLISFCGSHYHYRVRHLYYISSRTSATISACIFEQRFDKRFWPTSTASCRVDTIVFPAVVHTVRQLWRLIYCNTSSLRHGWRHHSRDFVKMFFDQAHSG